MSSREGPPRGRGSARATAAALAGLALAGTALAGCGGNEASGGGGAAPTSVEAVVAKRDTISVTVPSVGSLKADRIVELKTQANGTVTSLAFKEGERVDSGQVLVRLDEDKLRASVAAARATLRRAETQAANLEQQERRNQQLLAQGAISQQAFDDLKTQARAARAQAEEARADLSLARERLSDATIRAPFHGRVGERDLDIGDYLKEGGDVVTVVDDDTIEAKFAVPERFVGRLEIGKPVEIGVSSLPGETFRGKVSFVSPVVDTTNRAVTLKARVPNSDGELRSGQFANVTLVLEKHRDAIVLPEASVVPRSGRNFVFLVRSGIAKRKDVKLGERRPGIVEVLSGVDAGDTVVIAGQQKIQDGSPVSPQFSGPAEEVGQAPSSGASIRPPPTDSSPVKGEGRG